RHGPTGKDSTPAAYLADHQIVQAQPTRRRSVYRYQRRSVNDPTPGTNRFLSRHATQPSVRVSLESTRLARRPNARVSLTQGAASGGGGREARPSDRCRAE